MLPFAVSIAVLTLAQAGVVGLPARRALPALARLGQPTWAIAPAASIIAVVVAIRASADTARALTYVALVGVPILAAVGLGLTVRGARPWRMGLALGLFALAWADRRGLLGEGAGLLLVALSAAALGSLLAAITPARWLKGGIIAMALVDSALVIADLLQAPNDVLNHAHPAAGLPQLQRVAFGSAVMGFGDLFIAGVLGAVLAASGSSERRRGVMLTAAIGLAFNLLFFLVSELPATVPVALALVGLQIRARRRRRVRES